VLVNEGFSCYVRKPVKTQWLEYANTQAVQLQQKISNINNLIVCYFSEGMVSSVGC
jgi:hypothetical protein